MTSGDIKSNFSKWRQDYGSSRDSLQQFANIWLYASLLAGAGAVIAGIIMIKISGLALILIPAGILLGVFGFLGKWAANMICAIDYNTEQSTLVLLDMLEAQNKLVEITEETKEIEKSIEKEEHKKISGEDSDKEDTSKPSSKPSSNPAFKAPEAKKKVNNNNNKSRHSVGVAVAPPKVEPEKETKPEPIKNSAFAAAVIPGLPLKPEKKEEEKVEETEPVEDIDEVTDVEAAAEVFEEAAEDVVETEAEVEETVEEEVEDMAEEAGGIVETESSLNPKAAENADNVLPGSKSAGDDEEELEVPEHLKTEPHFLFPPVVDNEEAPSPFLPQAKKETEKPSQQKSGLTGSPFTPFAAPAEAKSPFAPASESKTSPFAPAPESNASPFAPAANNSSSPFASPAKSEPVKASPFLPGPVAEPEKPSPFAPLHKAEPEEEPETRTEKSSIMAKAIQPGPLTKNDSPFKSAPAASAATRSAFKPLGGDTAKEEELEKPKQHVSPFANAITYPSMPGSEAEEEKAEPEAEEAEPEQNTRKRKVPSSMGNRPTIADWTCPNCGTRNLSKVRCACGRKFNEV